MRCRRKRLKVQHAVAQRRRQRQQKDADTADKAALGAAPAGQLPDHGRMFSQTPSTVESAANTMNRKKRVPPPAAARHVVEYAGHRVKQQARPGSDLQPVGEAGREDDDAGQHRDKGVQQDDMDRFAHQRAVLADIAAEDRHAAHADRQREEGLIHGRHDDCAADLGEVRHQIEPQPLRRAGKVRLCSASTSISTSSAVIMYLVTRSNPPCKLKLSSTNAATTTTNRWVTLTFGSAIICAKAEIGVAPGQEFDKIVQNPACDNGVKAISAMLPIRLITPKSPPSGKGFSRRWYI